MPVLDFAKWDSYFRIPDLTIAKATIKAYSLQPTAQYEEGGLEYEIVLSQKPTKNILSIPFTHSNLRAGPNQRPLTEEENPSLYDVLTETEAWKNGQRVIYRPWEVVGSIPLYHASKRDNEYMTGKMGALYPPILVDAKGIKAKGSQLLDLANGLWHLTLPQDFLNGAAYPVVVDPTFGKTTVGASNTQPIINRLYCHLYTPTEAGTLTSISLYRTDPASGLSKTLLYKVSDLSKQGTSANLTHASGGTGWKTYTFDPGLGFTAVSQYLSHNTDTTFYIYFDAGAADQWREQSGITFCSEPATAAFTNSLARALSIYGTYTAAGAAGQPYISRVQRIPGMMTWGGVR